MQRMSVINLLDMLDKADLNLIAKQKKPDIIQDAEPPAEPKAASVPEMSRPVEPPDKPKAASVPETSRSAEPPDKPKAASVPEMSWPVEPPDEPKAASVPETSRSAEPPAEPPAEPKTKITPIGVGITCGKRKVEVLVRQSQIAKYQLDMLLHSTIAGLLPASCLQENEHIRLYYDIDGFTSFSDAVFLNELSNTEKLRLLEQIVVCTKKLHHYLLEPDNLVLDTSFIFFNQSREALLLYLPLKPCNGEMPNLKSGETVKLLKDVIRFVLYGNETVGVMPDDAKSISQIARFIDAKLAEEFYKSRQNEEQDDGEILVEHAQPHRCKKHKSNAGTALDFLHKRKAVFIGIQFLIFLAVISVYMLHILKPMDFIGFFIVAAATDIWVVKSIRRDEV